MMRRFQIGRARLALLAVVLIVTAECAPKGPPPAQPAATPPRPAPVSIDRKVGWILRLEQQRVLTDPAAGADLTALVTDADPGVRRRAALAIGRVGLPEGVRPLVAALTDAQESVRAMSAFGLGLLADPAAAAPLEAALADPSAIVRGRAAEALGQLGATPAAAAIATSAASCPALIAPLASDDEEYPKSGEIEACRLSILALVRLRQFDALARVVLADGKPVSSWWPVAFALQRSRDPRAADALSQMTTTPGVYTAAFAFRGLADLKDGRGVAAALAVISRTDADPRLRAEAIRALGRTGDARAVQPLMALLSTRATPPNLVLETISALGALGDPRAFTRMLDLFSAPSPQVRAGAMAAAAKMDAEGFLLALSSSEIDRDWSVRAALASVLGSLPAETARPAITALADDTDTRVQAPALGALAKAGSPDLDKRLFDALAAPDFGLRTAAAELLADHRPTEGAARLAAAYARGETDATPSARLAAIDAIARYAPPEGPQVPQVTETLTRALGDREWPVRLRAATLLRQRGVTTAAPLRPAPIRQTPEFFESDRVLRPTYSPQVYVETPEGTIQIELDVIEAPLTTLTFIELARSGFFNGVKVHRVVPNFVVQAGDPRGDGEGGPVFTSRDEFGTRPFVRGSVGMALGGPETAGSQFFVTVSPQPHLDARYTIFGRVVRGMELLDQMSIGAVITKVTVLDGAGQK
jgi:cyclophilin family peptidyl-prolyl cis-trans isomerase/HEAT repeat protein